MNRLRKGAFAILDQALLSLINLSITFAFIFWATKDDFAIYTLLFTPILLAQGVQAAILNAPFTTIYPNQNIYKKFKCTQALLWGHVILVFTLFVLSMIGLLLFLVSSGGLIDWLLIFSFGVAVMGMLSREGLRAFFYTRKDISKALRGDLVYALLISVSIFCLYLLDSITAASVLFFIGVSGFIVSIFQFSRKVFLVDVSFPGLSRVWQEYWVLGRWAIKGTVLNWINVNSYSYFAALIFGLSSVADIAASRVFWMPIILVATAWTNIFVPYITAWFANGDIKKIKKITYLTISAAFVLYGVTLLSLITIYPYVESHWLGDSYQGLFTLVILWSIVYFIQFIKTVFMASLRVNEQGFKNLSTVAWITLCSLFILLPIVSNMTFEYLIVMLVILELIQLIVILKYVSGFWIIRRECL